MVNKILVGARYGLQSWIAQRATAAYMAIFSVVFLIALALSRPGTYETWRAFVGQGWMRFALFLFLASLFYHAWIGIRDIYMDYIKPVGIRLALHVITIFLLVGYAGWAAQILWRL
jgi:succinate dehydrogenase / fumarate reductase, membrane anchor subunit